MYTNQQSSEEATFDNPRQILTNVPDGLALGNADKMAGVGGTHGVARLGVVVELLLGIKVREAVELDVRVVATQTAKVSSGFRKKENVQLDIHALVEERVSNPASTKNSCG